MKILSNNISTELRFQGDITEMKEIIRKLTNEERESTRGRQDLKNLMREFLTNAFGTADENKLDDTRAVFTKLDIHDILDDFTDYVMGTSWEELAEKNKKRKLARLAKNPRRELY